MPINKKPIPYKFKKQYRLPGWDYAEDGYYFVTICTKERKNLLGSIKNGQMELSPIGRVIKKYWLEIPEHFPDVYLDYFVIMPNHLHGVIIIRKVNPMVGTGQCRVPTEQFGHVKPKSLSTIIGSFKSISTKTIHLKYPNANFAWQPRFHDHIIRNEKELNDIRQYIEYNPEKWEWDKDHWMN